MHANTLNPVFGKKGDSISNCGRVHNSAHRCIRCMQFLFKKKVDEVRKIGFQAAVPGNKPDLFIPVDPWPQVML